MEWRRQSSVSCAHAFTEAQRWIEEVTGKLFGCNDFRAALENGVLLCDLINKLKPGIIKKVNRRSTPIAGLDNVNVFLKACGKLGLNVSQLFDPGDLQDLSTRVTLRHNESKRRLKNVLITIYWLGRKANLDTFYSGPQLNFKAFEGLLGLALSRALDEGANPKDGWYPDGEEDPRPRRSCKSQTSVDSVESLDPRTLHPNSEGCGSDAEAEQVFKMEPAQVSPQRDRGHVPPPPPQRKESLENGRYYTSPLTSNEEKPPCAPQAPVAISPPNLAASEGPFLQTLSEDDSEDDFAEADLVQDDLYFRRLRQSLRQTSSLPRFDRFLPQYWTPEEEKRVHAIFLGSRRRPWYHKMQQLSQRASRSTEEECGVDFLSWFLASRNVPPGSAEDTYTPSVCVGHPPLYSSFCPSSLEHTPSDTFKTHLVDRPSRVANKSQVPPERPVQVNPGWIWSKSLSDIPMVYPASRGPRGSVLKDVGGPSKWNPEKNQCAPVAEESEARWQDDLTKWKIRRRSTKSDLSRKSQDREHVIHQMTNGAGSSLEENGAGVPLERERRPPSSKGPSPLGPPAPSPSKAPGFDLQPRTRALLTRGYVSEVVLNPAASVIPHKASSLQRAAAAAMPASVGTVLAEESPFASLASDGSGVTTPSPEFPFTSQTQVKGQSGPSPLRPSPDPAPTGQIPSPVTTGGTWKDPSELCADPKVQTSLPDAVNREPVYSPESSQNPEASGQEQAGGGYKRLAQTGSWARSASLPRGYRRSEGSCRLSSAITAKPFSNKQCRVSSLARPYHVDDNRGPLWKPDKEESPSPPFRPSLKRQAASASLKVSPPAPSRQKNENQTGLSGRERTEAGTDAAGFRDNPAECPTGPSNACSDHSKVGHSVMRVSLTLKPNSRSDFGFQTRWDSTGARVQSIQPGSPAELCQLRVDDEIVALNGVPVAHMSSSQWMERVTSSLLAGSLTMDVRRYGNEDWSSSVGSHHTKPGQSRTTLNLTAAAPTLIGCPAPPAGHAARTETPAGYGSGPAGQIDGADGRLELSSAGDTGGGEPRVNGGALSPVLVTHGKVVRGEFVDNHRTARSEGGAESAISDLQVPSLSPSSSSWMWNYEEERRRQQRWQEEQERLLQEKYHRDQERLEAEWQKAQQDAMEDHRGDQKLNISETRCEVQLMNGQNSRVGDREQTPDRDGATPDRPCDARGAQAGTNRKQVWAEECCGFAQLSPSHRAKSLSTPALEGAPKDPTDAGEGRKRRGPSVSKVEQDRQQILEEMKKRTQLLTDNSWIRQRSSRVYRPVCASLKRFESLDNLDTSRHSAALPSYPRPHSAAASYYSVGRNPSRYSTGSVLPQMHDPAVSSTRAATDLPKSETRTQSAGSISSSSALVASPCDQGTLL